MAATKRKKTTKKTKSKTKAAKLTKAAPPVAEWPKPGDKPMESRELTGSKLRSSLRAWKNQINTDAGRTVVGFASEATSTYMLRRPFGITDMDVATGGGAPAGGPIQIAGPEASGKTYLAMQCLRMHQRIRGDAFAGLWVCAEPTLGFDFKRAAKMGLKIGLPKGYIPQLQQMRVDRGLGPLSDDELAVLMEQVGEMMIVQPHTGEEALEAVLSAVQSNLYGIVVVDSMTNLMPAANADKDLSDENKRAARASLITDFVNHYTPMVNRFGEPNYTTLIGIAQARAHPNPSKYTKDWEIPIAWAWKHAVLQNIVVWNGGRLEKTHHKVKRFIGKSVHWSIVKGKAGAHEHVQGEYDFYFDDVFPDLGLPHGVDCAESMVLEGMRCGTIREYQGKLVLVRSCDGAAFMDSIPSVSTLKQMINTDFMLEQTLRQEIMAARGIECRYQ